MTGINNRLMKRIIFNNINRVVAKIIIFMNRQIKSTQSFTDKVFLGFKNNTSNCMDTILKTLNIQKSKLAQKEKPMIDNKTDLITITKF